MSASINETYICLVSKKVDAQFVNEYHVVSHIPCLYKIIVCSLKEAQRGSKGSSYIDNPHVQLRYYE